MKTFLISFRDLGMKNSSELLIIKRTNWDRGLTSERRWHRMSLKNVPLSDKKVPLVQKNNLIFGYRDNFRGVLEFLRQWSVFLGHSLPKNNTATLLHRCAIFTVGLISFQFLLDFAEINVYVQHVLVFT